MFTTFPEGKDVTSEGFVGKSCVLGAKLYFSQQEALCGAIILLFF